MNKDLEQIYNNFIRGRYVDEYESMERVINENKNKITKLIKNEECDELEEFLNNISDDVVEKQFNNFPYSIFDWLEYDTEARLSYVDDVLKKDKHLSDVFHKIINEAIKLAIKDDYNDAIYELVDYLKDKKLKVIKNE